MPLTDREAFKVGFLARCAEDGMSRNEILACVKEATDKLAFTEGLVNAVKAVGVPLALTAAIAPPAVGALGGMGLARATDIDDADVKEVKDNEIIDSYQTESARLRRQKAIRDYARLRARTGRIFL